MSKENNKTVEVYKEKAWMYLNNSQEHDAMDWNRAKQKRESLENLLRNNLAENISKGSKVFEIGSGDGSNAEFIKSLGYKVTASDTANDFINAVKNKGVNTIKFNVLEDKFQDSYSAIFCWRVFVHFTIEDAKAVLQKVYDTLEDGGIFIFNAINRETKEIDSEWIDFEGEYHMGAQRFYQYFKEDELNEIIKSIGYKIYDFHKDGGDNDNKWLIYVLKK